MLASMSATEWSEVDMAELLPTGTVTLLLADVEGSTKLWETQPATMTTAMARLNRAASQLIAEHGGVRPVEQGEGDSFVAASHGPATPWLRTGLAAKHLAPIKLRIGVHTGEVQLRDEGNYAGPRSIRPPGCATWRMEAKRSCRVPARRWSKTNSPPMLG